MSDKSNNNIIFSDEIIEQLGKATWDYLKRIMENPKEKKKFDKIMEEYDKLENNLKRNPKSRK